MSSSKLLRFHSVLSCVVIVLAVKGAYAGQSVPHISIAHELQRRGDLIAAEKELQAELAEARAAGSKSMEVGRSLAMLGAFYQDIGKFSQAELSFMECLNILRNIIGKENIALAPVITHLGWLYVE